MRKYMNNTSTKNGFMNFLYRIFIGVEKMDDAPLRLDSSDPIEAELAASQEKIATKTAAIKSGKGKSNKFKVEKIKDEDLRENPKTNIQKENSREELER